MNWFDDQFDDQEDESGALVECRRCGKGGLAWEDDNGRWRLVDSHGEVHRCDPAKIAKLVAADFEALD